MKSYKKNIFVPITILVVIFFTFIIVLTNIKYKEVNELDMVKIDIESSVMVSKLIHEIQIERGLSIGYIVSNGKIFSEKLQKQRLVTKQVIKEFQTQINIVKCSDIINKINETLKKIDIVRDQVDRLNKKPKDVLKFYSKIVNSLIQSIYQLTKKVNGSDLREKILAYLNFLQFKESAGIERATGTMLILNNIMVPKLKLEYYKQIIKQEEYEKVFKDIVSKDIKKKYNSSLSNKFNNDTNTIRDMILKSSRDTVLDISVSFWFNSISQKIDTLKNIEDYITKDILKYIAMKIKENNVRVVLFLMLIILSIIFVIYTIYTILNILKEDLRLKYILDRHIISSTTDVHGKIISVSSAFCDISGFNKEELIGKPHNIIRHKDMSAQLFEEMWNQIKSGEEYSGNVKNRNKSGGYYWVNVNIEPVYDNYGNIKSYIAIKHNITDKINLENAIEKNRMKDKQLLHQSRLAQMGEMISMIAHQWRQPLAAISSTSSGILIKAQLGRLDKETAIKLSKNISEFSQHLSTTIDDFRDFFKVNKEKKILHIVK